MAWGNQSIVFDPIPLSSAGLETISRTPPSAIVLTSGNHLRAVEVWRTLFPVPVWVPPQSELANEEVQVFDPAAFPFAGWQAIPLSGGGPGETAYFLEALSLVVFGDAVIHLPGRGLEVLPDKYCSNPKTLRAGLLRCIEELAFENALFAHGTPILGKASERIRALVTPG